MFLKNPTLVANSSSTDLLSVLLLVGLLLNSADLQSQFVDFSLGATQEWEVGVVRVRVLQKTLNYLGREKEIDTILCLTITMHGLKWNGL